MARILFSAFSNITWLDKPLFDPFYEGLLLSLKNYGNEIFVIRTNDFIWQFDNHIWHEGISKIDLINSVLKFNPELIITANNSIPFELLNSCDCPICLYSADAPAHYSSKNDIRDNVDRYTFLHVRDNILGNYCKEMFKCKDNQLIHAGYYTAITHYDCNVLNNIIFIGSLGWPQSVRDSFQQCKDQFTFDLLYDKFKTKTSSINDLDTGFLHLFTFSERVKTLDAISDLGLKIHGQPFNILEAVPYCPNILNCFDFYPVVTLKETEKRLNQSLIAPTLFNAQAPGGMSWRVADVMASNACLISPPKNDLKWISPYINIPTFSSPIECRELCLKLLKDDIWRKDIVIGSQKAIEERCRFVNLFTILQNYFNISLINNKSGIISYAIPRYNKLSLRFIKQSKFYPYLRNTKLFSFLKFIYRKFRP